MSTDIKPFVVSVREARRLIGNVSHNTFWRLIREGHFELVGGPSKRFVVLTSLEKYIDQLPRSSARGVPAKLRRASAPADEARHD